MPESEDRQVIRRWVKVKRAAEYADVSERFIWTLIQRGELPVSRVGRTTRIDLNDLDRLFGERKVGRVAG